MNMPLQVVLFETARAETVVRRHHPSVSEAGDALHNPLLLAEHAAALGDYVVKHSNIIHQTRTGCLGDGGETVYL